MRVLVVAILLAGGSVAVGQPQRIELKASDGRATRAYAQGEGEVTVILAHGRGYKDGGRSFDAVCAAFAAKGVRCAAIDFRGYPAKDPASLSGKELDIVAAFEWAARDARRIILVGCSMGGGATLRAAAALKDREKLAGIVLLSSVHEKLGLDAPARKLFVAAEDDPASAKSARSMFDAAAEPRELEIYERGGHGQVLFSTQPALLDAITELASE